MQWADFNGKNVGLLGAGIENIALVPHLQKNGANVTVCNETVTSATEQLSQDSVRLVVGSDYLSELGRFDYVFRIAGMPVSRLENALRGLKKPPIVTSATDFFLALRPCRIIGVTGTKGKGTTSTMIGGILAAADLDVSVIGNIGKPIFEVMDSLTPDSYAVLELSSFQLEDASHSPEIAVVLPISEDHLQPLSQINPNYHPSMNDYVAAKAQITLHQSPDDVLVFAADNPDSTAIASVSKAKKISVSQAVRETHFSVDSRGMVYQNGKPFLSLSDFGLAGQHIFLNATMAIAACVELEISPVDIGRGLKSFKPLPHRLQDLGERDSIRYVDDSYATTPEATAAALTAFSEPVVLVMGGSSKGASFDELSQKVAKSSVKAVVLVGQEAKNLEKSLTKFAPDVRLINGAKDMKEVISLARSTAKDGDTILLSPACASKDMFSDAADRGRKFQEAIDATAS